MEKPRKPKLLRPEPKLGEEAGWYDDGRLHMRQPTAEEMAEEAEAERIWRDESFFTMDEAGTRITGFRRDWGLFKIVRDVLASHGVDIESITDPEELENLIDLHRETIHELLSLKIQSEAHKSTERALLATVTRRDTEEADRLSDKLKRRRAMGMRVVDGGKWE